MSESGNRSYSPHDDPEIREHVRRLNQASTPPDPVQQAVDNYILMERKARAWDEWRRIVGPRNEYLKWEGKPLVDVLDVIEKSMQSF